MHADPSVEPSHYRAPGYRLARRPVSSTCMPVWATPIEPNTKRYALPSVSMLTLRMEGRQLDPADIR